MEYGGNIHISQDSGDSWSESAFPAAWSDVSCSDDGGFIAATIDGDRVFISTDHGASWVPVTLASTPKDWLSVSILPNTHKAFATDGKDLFLLFSPSLCGQQGSMLEMQYIGNGQWHAIDSAGDIDYGPE